MNQRATRSNTVGRRGFLGGTAAVAAAVATGAAPAWASARPKIPADPFTLGVASGDPLPNAVVLWTRLAPAPTVDGGGMPRTSYWVHWEIAEDEKMTRGRRRGFAIAHPDNGHSVHVDVRGLRPDRTYWYRFRVDGHVSPIGRTRTAPRRQERGNGLSFGLVSCQRYSSGYYNAYDDIVASDVDLVIHVGDYIYETGGDGVRSDPLPESITLDQYRNRYGLYKSEPSLRAAHRAAPWLFTWDDHEVENNYTGDTPEQGSSVPDPIAFLARRAAAYKAYWEHMPTRAPAPTGPDFRIHRRIGWGLLADLFVLDTRQYRTDQTCGVDDIGGLCDAAFDPATTVLGRQQEGWLDRELRRSDVTWTVLAQQIVFSKMAIAPGNPGFYNLDQWDGYVAARTRLLQSMSRHRPSNNIVLTGDIHSSGTSHLLTDYDNPDSPRLGAEFVGTSVSSTSSLSPIVPTILANNPHIQWAEATRRGWVHHRVSHAEWRADYRHVADNTVAGSPLSTATSWSVPSGGELTQL